MARPRKYAVEGSGNAAPDSTDDVSEGQMPTRIILTAPHGFIDENDRHRYWNAGEVVSEPHEVALLIERGAPVEEVE